VFAEGYPDYRGGLSNLTMIWRTPKSTLENRVPEVQVFWTRGPTATAPPGWLDLASSLDVMRRLGTEVEADVADYERRCYPIHIEIDLVATPVGQAGAGGTQNL
jgi:hypothetical protein